ncbi:hypothetical protein QQ045_028887 [Rhodiola kirilowii]
MISREDESALLLHPMPLPSDIIALETRSVQSHVDVSIEDRNCTADVVATARSAIGDQIHPPVHLAVDEGVRDLSSEALIK